MKKKINPKTIKFGLLLVTLGLFIFLIGIAVVILEIFFKPISVFWIVTILGLGINMVGIYFITKGGGNI